MKCPRCQQENSPSMKFCGECGARLASVCLCCRATNPLGQKFCGDCGAPLSQGGAVATSAAPAAYTPRHLAEKILTSKSALEGERKQVTVLFADLKGSMEVLADRDPEEARKLLDPVLEYMMEAVHRYEGTVNQVMGDGIMALFGAPLAHEDHAVRACYAALRMQGSVKQYAEGVRRTDGVPIQIRVGLNSGEVVVRSIGSDLRMDYTAVGQTTHLAARMEQMAAPGSILVTQDTLSLAEGFVQVQPLGSMPIKGLDVPVEVYEVTGTGTIRSRLHAAAARGLTRFVGRDGELDQLRQVLERARTGHGQVVAVIGEPGVGKSRLFYEFTHRTQGWLILETRSLSYGKATSYLPVIDLLKGYFQIEARDTTGSIREKVTGKLLSLDESLEPTLPALLALLDVPIEDERWDRLDPSQRRQRTLDAVKRLLLRESQVQPVLIVCEDLHWIDSETQAILDRLVESLPTVRILLLVNYRPEYQHGCGNRTSYRQLQIDPLLPESAERLLHTLLGHDAALLPLTQSLIERTEGNPFFLEESVRSLIEMQVLIGERGAYRLAKTWPGIQVPGTVQTVLAARIDRLPPETKRLLQSAAVIGKDLPLTLLQAIAELPESDLRQSLTHLQAAEFLHETRLFPDPEYTFKHALTQEVAYGSLLQERRRSLHARIVGAMEELYRDRLAEQVDRLGHHAFRGESWGAAVVYLRQAGAKAFARSAYREAMSAFEQALVALGHQPASPKVLEEAVDIRLDLWRALAPLAEYRRMLDCLREAEAVAERLGDQRRIGLVAVHLSHSLFSAGDPDGAVRYGQRVLSIATNLGDFDLQISANWRLGRVYYVLGDYRQVAFVGHNLVAALEGDRAREAFGNPFPVSVSARNLLVWSLAERGDFVEGITRGEEAVAIARALDQPLSLCVASATIGVPYLRKGDLDRAIILLEQGLELSRTWDIRYWFAYVASALGEAYALSGRLPEALPLLEEAVARTAAPEFRGDHALHVARLSAAYLLAERRKDALTLAERALSLARDHKERGNEAWALRLLGEIAWHRDPPHVESAQDHYGQALALAADLGMRPLVAHCHLGLGRLYGRTGKPQQARKHLATATTMYREMDMRFWLEQAEAESKELG